MLASLCFFVYVLVSVLRVSVTADFICSDLMFYCSGRSTKCSCCCCCCCSVRTHLGMSGLPGQYNHVNEIKVQLLQPPCQSLRNAHTYWGVLCCRKQHRLRRVTFISTLYHFILPPLHPSHRSICLSSPLSFSSLSPFLSFRLSILSLHFTPSICLSLSTTSVALVLSIQHLPCSLELSLPLVFSLFLPHLLSSVLVPMPHSSPPHLL